MTQLDEKLAAALTGDTTSSAVKALIEEVELASQAASETAARVRQRPLDLALSPKEVAGARSEAVDATFTAERLQAAVPQLQLRHTELRAIEEHTRRWLRSEFG